jgi:F-type H+-transporting ATPase subunit b
MPQIAQLAETYSSQIFWLLVVFGLVFFVVGRGMVPRVLDTVGMRDQQISSDLAAAQAARDEADAKEEAWRKRENENRAAAQALVGQAKTSAQADTERRLAEVQVRLDARLEEAEARIATSREEAAAEIETVATEAAQDIVARLAGIHVDEGAARQAVTGAMARV